MRDLEELTTHCIRCGFCLEACPTFKLTGDETESPRGRIYLVRSAIADKLAWEEIREPLDHCLGCRACETACPSAVEYGAILEMARTRLGAPKPVKNLTKMVTSAAVMRILSTVWAGHRAPAILGHTLGPQAQEATVPGREPLANWPAINPFEVPKIRGEVALLEGCVMQALYPRVHQATRRLLRRVGYKVRSLAGCCGALHAHSGQTEDAHALAEALVNKASGLPLIVNSAGCGSALKEYGAWLGTRAAAALAERTFDLSEFLVTEGLGDELANAQGLGARATYHEACHLAHGQRVRSAPRELLSKVHGLEIIPLPESDMCCGSAGIYNLLQPKMARKLLDRKWKNIEQTGARLVVLGNPGCQAWIAQAALEKGGAVRVMHLAEVLEWAFMGGLLPDQRPAMPRSHDYR